MKFFILSLLLSSVSFADDAGLIARDGQAAARRAQVAWAQSEVRLQHLANACMGWLNQTNQANLRSIKVTRTNPTFTNGVLNPLVDKLLSQERERFTVALSLIDNADGRTYNRRGCEMTVSPYWVAMSGCDFPQHWGLQSLSCFVPSMKDEGTSRVRQSVKSGGL